MAILYSSISSILFIKNIIISYVKVMQHKSESAKHLHI